MARSDWDIRGIIIYIDDSSNVMDIYEYAERISKQIPIGYIFGLLNISEQKFVDILNENVDSKKHLITNYEEEFRYERKTLYGYRRLFTKNQVFGLFSDLSVELSDFEDWLDDNYNLLKENRVIHEEVSHDQEYDTMKARVAELEAELASLKDENAQFRSEVEAVKPWGIWKTILDMRNEGKTASEVAQYLFDKGISNDRIFLLLYPDEVIDGITDKTQYGANLRAGKTKKLPW